MDQVEISTAGMETDGFEVLPSKPLSDEKKNEIFRLASFKCPVCGLTGGPTFTGPNGWHVSVTFQGLCIPSDHTPECLENAQDAYFYISGQMDDAQMAQYVHTADAECSHPKCLAKRLWGTS